MSTSKKVHLKIQEISSKYLSGKTPIYINSIATELGVTKDVLEEHIQTLLTLELVDYADDTKEIVILTDSGKLTKPE